MKILPIALALCLTPPTVRAAEPAIQFDNPLVKDVPAAFARIGGTATRLGIRTSGIIPYPFYSLNLEHDFGDNHFQGIQRLRAGNYVIISGGNISRRGDLTHLGLPQPEGIAAMPEAHGDLIVARLTSRPALGRWGSNLDDATGRPESKDRAILDLEISLPLPSGTTIWHPGGISACGDILVVPMENYNIKHGELCSQIVFYDVSRPEQPRLLPPLIDRSKPPVREKSGGATMVRLPDERFLLVTTTTTFVSFYFSRSIRFSDGFELRPAAVLDNEKVRADAGLKPAKFGGSSIHFVKQADGTLFLISFRRIRTGADGPGQEVASLWRLNFPRNDYHADPVLTRIADRSFTQGVIGEDAWGSFGAAAGIYITAKGGIAFYAAPHWQTTYPGRITLDGLKTGNAVHADDDVFIPMAEMWPR